VQWVCFVAELSFSTILFLEELELWTIVWIIGRC